MVCVAIYILYAIALMGLVNPISTETHEIVRRRGVSYFFTGSVCLCTSVVWLRLVAEFLVHSKLSIICKRSQWLNLWLYLLIA